MSTVERKAVSELTDFELWRELCEHQGIGAVETSEGYAMKTKTDGRIGWHYMFRERATLDDVWEAVYGGQSTIPRWPTDTGAAFELCRDVLDRLNATDPDEMWQFQTGIGGVSFEWLVYGGGIWDSIGAEGRNARALSELAALALRQMDEDAC